MIQVKSYLKVLKKAKLTPAQYLLLHCLHFRFYVELLEYAEMFPPHGEDEALIGSYWFKDLITRGFLEATVKNPTEARHFKAGDKFLEIFIDKYIAIEEIWEVYPDFMTKNSVKYPIKAADQEKMAEVYFEKIGGVIAEHIEVMEDIRFMVASNNTYCSIEKFIGSKGWIAMRKLRKVSGSATNSANTKMF